MISSVVADVLAFQTVQINLFKGETLSLPNSSINWAII